jgi:Thioesterase domain
MTEISRTEMLPKPLYRGLKALTLAWPGERVSKESLLIQVHQKPNTKKLPLIWVGGPEELPELIEEVGAERSIYGTRGTFDFADPTKATKAVLSQYYAAEIMAHIPGPYVIAGNCDAAFLAMEIANRLLASGHQIEFLGVIELDLTEKSRALRWAKAFFKATDKVGRIGYRTAGCFKNKPFKQGAKDLVALFSKKTLKNDPRQKIKYSDLDVSPLYEINPYPGPASLIYIRWGGYGYVQFSYFQNYWRKLCKGGITVDIVPGWSHEFPNWKLIFKKLNQRMNAAGLNFFLMLDWQSQPCFQPALWAI